MWLFIGIWLSDEMREEVVRFIERRKELTSGFKWTAPENLHFTLKFLGEIEKKRLPELRQSLRKVADNSKSFLLQLGSVGYFPLKGPPRIVWVGVQQGSDQLVQLANLIENTCFISGFSKSDKPFKAHLTVARAKRELPFISFSKITDEFQSNMPVTGFSLIESRLYSTESVYQNLETFQFND